MKTVRLKITKHCHIFQKGNILEVEDAVVQDASNANVSGYSVPDIGNGLPGILPLKSVKKIAGKDEETGSHYGKCLLTKLSNFYETGAAPAAAPENAGDILPTHIRVIHYPDCQQLMFHMPKYAYDAGAYRLINNVTGELIENVKVRDHLSGGTMVLLDTLSYKPGFYTIEAAWPDGWTHQIRFIKFIESFPEASYENPPRNVELAIKNQECHLLPAPVIIIPPKITIRPIEKPKPYANYVHPPGNVTMIQNDKEHRLFDSNGVEIENGVDIKSFKRDLALKFGPVAEYTQDGRGGTIYYAEKDLSMEFYWEFGGGNAIVVIDIPEEKYWEAQTKKPLAERDSFLSRMAERVIQDKAPGCHFQMYSNSISILR
ncbi:MAG: hypothetical protein ABIN80_21445 [Dyadobacter sp.]|uniref:hypothetical protein n=1 Tax=Dyadobacter sp. TaxID=1914288 RepID=UPI003265EAA6